VPRYSRLTTLLILAAAVGIIVTWTVFTPPGITGKADAIGYAICHRITVRSFIAGDYQLPLCARCTGIYLGAMTAFGVFIASGRYRAGYLPHWKVALGLAGFVGLLGIDGLNSYSNLLGFEGLYVTQNWMRVVTGVFCGLTLGNLVFPIFNQSVWEDGGMRTAPIHNLKELAGLALIGALMVALVLVQRPTLLLILGMISAAGVLMVLTMIMTVGFVTVTGRFRAYNTWKDLALPLTAGLTLAIIMIGGIDFLRYQFTGTWEGFLF